MGSNIICAINSVAEILRDLQAGLFSNRYVYWKWNKASAASSLGTSSISTSSYGPAVTYSVSLPPACSTAFLK
jgi:hypothetical protein